MSITSKSWYLKDVQRKEVGLQCKNNYDVTTNTRNNKDLYFREDLFRRTNTTSEYINGSNEKTDQ